MSEGCKYCEYIRAQSDDDLKLMWQCLHDALHVRFPEMAAQGLQPEHLTEEGRLFLQKAQQAMLPESQRGRAQ